MTAKKPSPKRRPKPKVAPKVELAAVATLAEKTVQKVAEGKVAPVKKKAKAKPRPKVVLDKHIKVRPEVWTAASKIIDDPNTWYFQIEIVDNETVIVR